MKTLLFFISWCLLFVLCWPIAILALVLAPFVWLISLPLRLVGITFEAMFAAGSLCTGSAARVVPPIV